AAPGIHEGRMDPRRPPLLPMEQGSGSESRLPVSGLYADRYELTMAWAYWRDGRTAIPATFDYFFRKAPFGGAYAVFAGAGSLVEALEDFRFGPAEIEYLRATGFEDGFLDYLSGFRFGGSIWMPP